MRCDERLRLAREYGSLLNIWNELVQAALSHETKPRFTVAIAQTEPARLAAESARIALEEHRVAHGC